MVILGVLLWNRWHVSGLGDTPVSGIPPVDEAPLGWSSAVGKAAVRSLTLLFRMVCITVPLMLCIEWLLKNGAFNFWEQYVPDQVNRFFPAELVSVVAAQMGGMVQSSAVAANLRAEGLIDNAQILLAMLVGSAVGNPFRTLRRNLPSALGIFPVPVAFAIVIGMQLSRFVVTLVAIAGSSRSCIMCCIELGGGRAFRSFYLPPNLPLPLQRLSTDGEATRKEFVPAKDVEEGEQARATEKPQWWMQQ